MLCIDHDQTQFWKKKEMSVSWRECSLIGDFGHSKAQETELISVGLSK